MYFWNTNALARDLKANKVSGYEKAKYYLAGLIIVHIVLSLPQSATSSHPLYLAGALGLFFFNLCITIWGIFHLYNINNKGDDKDFVSRAVCLGLPASIRLLVISFLATIPILIVIGLVMKLKMGDDYTLLEPQLQLLSRLLIGIFTIFYYFYLGKKIRYVSGGSPEL